MQSMLRPAAGAVAVTAAWIFPFAAGPSAIAQPQIFALGALALATALYGFSHVHRWVVAGAAGAALLLLLRSGVYPAPAFAAAAYLLLAALAFHSGAKLRQDQRANDWLLWAVVAAAVINALEGLLQYLGLAGALWPWVPESLLRGVAFGAFRQPNLFATFLCCGLVCTAWLLHRRRLSQSMAWFAAGVLQAGIAASTSRTGLVCVLLLGAAAYAWRRDQIRPVTRLLLGQVVLYAAWAAILPWLAALHGFEPRALGARMAGAIADTRLTLWANALDMLLARPWLGWGWGEFGWGHYVTLHAQRVGPGQTVDNAHNMLLQLAVELGTPAALLIVGLLAYGVTRSSPFTAAQRQQQFAWGILLVIGSHSLVEFPLWYATNVFLAAFAAGHLAPAVAVPARARGDQARCWTLTAAAAVLMLASATAWRQYQSVSAIYDIPTRDAVAKRAAIASASDAWLFGGAVDFAQLGMAAKSQGQPAQLRILSERLLHFSAEPAVVEPLLAALWQLGDKNAFQFHERRYCQAFPRAHAQWRALRSPRERDNTDLQEQGACR